MSRFKFTNGSRFWGMATSVRMRSPEEIAERKRLSALRREERRMLRKIEKMNQGKNDV